MKEKNNTASRQPSATAAAAVATKLELFSTVTETQSGKKRHQAERGSSK